jgi:hypothetical protein
MKVERLTFIYNNIYGEEFSMFENLNMDYSFPNLISLCFISIVPNINKFMYLNKEIVLKGSKIYF